MFLYGNRVFFLLDYFKVNIENTPIRATMKNTTINCKLTIEESLKKDQTMLVRKVAHIKEIINPNISLFITFFI